ncbi:MAG TPA: hypothetical protein VFV38_48145 [Ktedonobacteraceae bacterium]|nr:hypothetical protein [Ktedonobacteraceae bacterium]
MQKLDQFDDLLAQGHYVQRKMAEGKEIGRIETLQNLALEFIKESFPSLTQVAQPQIKNITKPDSLNALIKGLAKAQDEQTARILLDMFAV